jgi:oxaloacetate decarboxylase gamma subunit
MSSQSISDLLFEAATLLLVGMTVVFAFLAILIVCVNLLAKLCERFPGQEPQAPTRASAGRSTTTKTDGLDANVVAAISAAVHTHRQTHR